jgi:hypothetical protein
MTFLTVVSHPTQNLLTLSPLGVEWDRERADRARTTRGGNNMCDSKFGMIVKRADAPEKATQNGFGRNQDTGSIRGVFPYLKTEEKA